MNILDILDTTPYICCFCETEFEGRPIYCGTCRDYKGIMTLSDYEAEYPY